MIIVGIDEAGYGPLLGPLVVTGAAFSVPEALAGADLWEVLSASICRRQSRHDLRLPIADSKKLYNRKRGLTALERSVLVMLHTAESQPRTLRGLLKVLSCAALADLDDYPWYEGFDSEIPSTTTPADIATRANAVRRDLRGAGLTVQGVSVELLCAGHFNRLIERTRNKATVLMGLALRLAQRVLQGSEQGVRICVDRHGGREHYVEKLMTFFEGCRLRVVEESDCRSAYELSSGPRSWSIEFVKKGEDEHLPIALASMYSKYVRELLMQAINGYFRRRLRGLTPTAGYYKDARRFLADVEPVIRTEGLERSMLIRSR